MKSMIQGTGWKEFMEIQMRIELRIESRRNRMIYLWRWIEEVRRDASPPILSLIRRKWRRRLEEEDEVASENGESDSGCPSAVFIGCGGKSPRGILVKRMVRGGSLTYRRG